MRTVFTLLLALAALHLGRAARAQAPAAVEPAPETTAADEKILQDLKERIDSPGLLEFFRKRTFPEADPKRLQTLLRQLGDRSFGVREKARAQLIELGPSCMVALREAEQSRDHEVRRRALDIRTRIERKADPIAECAAARLLAARKPEQAAAVLLSFLPFAADDAVIEEVCRALPAVAVRSGKPEPVVVEALKDKLAVKRAAAGAALVKAGAADQLPAARALLKDRELTVRLRVAIALVADRREPGAVDTLIAALEHLPPDQLWPAEEVLIRIAGDKAPQVSLGNDAEGRLKCKQAWQGWWDGARKGIDLAKVEMRKTFLGYTLVVQRTFNRIVGGMRRPPAGQVSELDAGKNVRWSFDLPTYPVYAEVVGPDRVLLAEFQGNRVSERDFKGNVKWEKAVNGNPLAAQRLPNGNTFVVLQNRLVEYDRKGNQVYHMDRPNFDIFRARKLRNGQVVYITAAGSLTRLDPRNGNKVVATFNVGPMGSQFGSFEVLPNGNYLIPVYGTREVIEFDPNGKRVWSAAVPWPTSVQRLPNGNTLVASQISRRLIELDRTGREVWRHDADGQVFMVHRR